MTLENPGDRNQQVTEDAAQELIAQWRQKIEDNPDEVVETLDLSNRTYTVAAMRTICNFLRDRVSFVKNAVLHDIIASLPTDQGLEVLEGVSTLLQDSPLEHLDLDDNALGIRGVHRCRNIISLPTLQFLSLQNDGLSAESMTDIDAMIENKENLRTVRIYNNMIGVEGAKATGNILSKCDNLTYFRYEGCRPQPEGTDGIVGGLASVVRRNKSHPLEVIELEGTIEGESVEKLCNDVLENIILRRLRLYDCSLDSERSQSVLVALEGQKRLEHIDLSNNEIGASDRFGPVILNNGATLKAIKLENTELTSRGVERLCRALNNANTPLALEELDLKDNQIGTRGAEALLAARDAMPNLQVLRIDDNSFSEEVLERLQTTFGDVLLEMENNEDDFDYDDDLPEEDEPEEEDNLEGVVAGMAEVGLIPDDDDVSL